MYFVGRRGEFKGDECVLQGGIQNSFNKKLKRNHSTKQHQNDGILTDLANMI